MTKLQRVPFGNSCDAVCVSPNSPATPVVGEKRNMTEYDDGGSLTRGGRGEMAPYHQGADRLETTGRVSSEEQIFKSLSNILNGLDKSNIDSLAAQCREGGFERQFASMVDRLKTFQDAQSILGGKYHLDPADPTPPGHLPVRDFGDNPKPKLKAFRSFSGTIPSEFWHQEFVQWAETAQLALYGLREAALFLNDETLLPREWFSQLYPHEVRRIGFHGNVVRDARKKRYVLVVTFQNDSRSRKSTWEFVPLHDNLTGSFTHKTCAVGIEYTGRRLPSDGDVEGARVLRSHRDLFHQNDRTLPPQPTLKLASDAPYENAGIIKRLK